MLGMEVRERQEQAAVAGQAPRLPEHDAPFAGPMPVSTTSAASSPSTTPTFGTRLTRRSGKTKTPGAISVSVPALDEQRRIGHRDLLGVGSRASGCERPGREALDGLAEALGLLERRAVGAALEEDAARRRGACSAIQSASADRPVRVVAAPGGEHRHREALDDRSLVELRLLAHEADGDVERRLQRDCDEPVDVLRVSARATSRPGSARSRSGQCRATSSI